ncbi:MAG TPA: hypothetical protein VMW31_03400 [Devosiaceae bacterium]|nr:hypothetical protein [Devosiaceae bacterium]
MPNYFIGYQGGTQTADPQEGARQQEKWKAWMGGLGDAIVNFGTPLVQSRAVTAGGVSEVDKSAALTGYSIISADSMDAALEIAGACPYLDTGGTVLVAEAREMPR